MLKITERIYSTTILYIIKDSENNYSYKVVKYLDKDSKLIDIEYWELNIQPCEPASEWIDIEDGLLMLQLEKLIK